MERKKGPTNTKAEQGNPHSADSNSITQFQALKIELGHINT